MTQKQDVTFQIGCFGCLIYLGATILAIAFVIFAIHVLIGVIQ